MPFALGVQPKKAGILRNTARLAQNIVEHYLNAFINVIFGVIAGERSPFAAQPQEIRTAREHRRSKIERGFPSHP